MRSFFHASMVILLCGGLLATPRSATAEILFPLDGSFTLVDFCGDGGTGSGPAVCPDQHNDDDSATVPLGFTFSLYGDTYTTAYVNNNGNLSFGTFESSGNLKGLEFPTDRFAMVAPFWADVDTGSANLPIGDVYQKLDSGLLVVHWEEVGHAFQIFARRNRFQVAISDGTNETMGLGNNVCFSFDGMEWASSDLAGGTDGFEGTPAVVGVNRGDGTDFALIGNFNSDDFDYDGPFGNPDGLRFLDGETNCFDTDVTDSNIAPIPIRYPLDGTIEAVCEGDTLLSTIVGFLSPEAGQNTFLATDDMDGAAAAGLNIQVMPGPVAALILLWDPDCADIGSYRIGITATDTAAVPGVTTRPLTIEVVSSAIFASDFEGGDLTDWSANQGG